MNPFGVFIGCFEERHKAISWFRDFGTLNFRFRCQQCGAEAEVNPGYFFTLTKMLVREKEMELWPDDFRWELQGMVTKKIWDLVRFAVARAMTRRLEQKEEEERWRS